MKKNVRKQEEVAQQAPSPVYAEAGVTGLIQYAGTIYEEFLPNLQGTKGRELFREMRDNCAIMNGFLQAVENISRNVKWTVEKSKMDTTGEGEKFLNEVLFEDMSHTWQDFITECYSFTTYGWAFHEIVFKRRDGDRPEPWRRSKFNDGKIGIRKLAPRAQTTLWEWKFDTDGGIQGIHQQDNTTGKIYYIPIEKGLLFRTKSHKNNPEGRSLLRPAYRAYYMAKKLEEIEAIAAERDLVGVPLLRIPSSIMAAGGEVMDIYSKIAKDLKFNEQGGVIIPSDMWPDSNGNPTSAKLYDVELISAQGSRLIDTDKLINRYNTQKLISVMADFLMLGANSEKGSYALSKSKADLFLLSIQCLLSSIEQVINRYLVTRLWALNGFPKETMPQVKAGKVAPEDLAELGSYLQALSTSGVIVGGDEKTDNFLRELGGLPPIDQTTMRTSTSVLDPVAEAAVQARVQDIVSQGGATGSSLPS